jgi:hypothetical protein
VQLNTKEVVADLLLDSAEWRRFFRQCCETSCFRLRSQAWQWGAELRDRGRDATLEDLEDALSDLARELMPGSPGAAWDVAWQRELLERAERYAQEKMGELPREHRGAVDVRCDLLAHVGRAAAERNRTRYRVALRAWCQGVKDAVVDVGRGAG